MERPNLGRQMSHDRRECAEQAAEPLPLTGSHLSPGGGRLGALPVRSPGLWAR
jgi:hypothetical protein